MGKRGGERVDWLVENVAEREVGERARERGDGVVEFVFFAVSRFEREVGERGREVVDGLVKKEMESEGFDGGGYRGLGINYYFLWAGESGEGFAFGDPT